MRRSTLADSGSFYKGNLHTHSTISDGQLSPEKMVARYKSLGYDFLSLTDHEIYGTHEEYTTADFLMVPGSELAVDAAGGGDFWRCHHLLAIGGSDNCYAHGHQFDRKRHNGLSLQQLVDEVRAQGNLVIYNHPHWSRVELNQFDMLNGLNGMEIFNYGCAVENRTGNSESYYYGLLLRHKNMWCYSTDDAHCRLNDVGGGYIVAKAASLTLPDIYAALESGSFYACNAETGKDAPHIEKFYWEDGIAHLECSPCKRVQIVADTDYFSEQDLENCALTGGELKVPATAYYVRAMCESAEGFLSWSQPIFLQD